MPEVSPSKVPEVSAVPEVPEARTERSRQKADRRARLLRAAARLFAERGFHGVSIEDLGASVEISGPAVYRHFPNKDAVLAALLIGVSERLLEGGCSVVAAAGDDEEALRRLVVFHTEFALTEPELISVQGRDLPNLSAPAARAVRRLQREYVEIWVGVLTRLDPGLTVDEARTRAHAVFGLLNSTPYSARFPDDAATRAVLQTMAYAGLTVR
ncbi:MAG TPA: TetR/AcrR family transcriptional regulator [Frankiaceae bacterium]|nr:TetR/AcrR family transcriptional regulator [Frankiaceae bacterium]